MPDTAKIIQNVNLGNTKEGKNTKTEQNFNPGFAPIGLSGTRPSILTTVFFFLSRNYSSVEIFTENGMAVRLMQSS